MLMKAYWSKWVVVFGMVISLIALGACGASDSTTQGDNTTTEEQKDSNSESSTEELEKVSLLLDWSWWPGQTPIIVAQEKGFYEEAGLEVEIQQGQGSANTTVGVGEGTHDLGHVNQSNTASAISNGVPITAIATLQQKGATSLTFFKETDIQSPEDLKGLKIGSTGSGSDAQILSAFLDITGIRDDVEVVSMQGDAKINALFSGQTDAISGDFYYYEAQLEEQGREAESLLFADYGVNMIGFGYIANNEFLENNPETVKKFLEATFKGYEYTYENLDEAVEIFIERTDYSNSAEFVKKILLDLQELFTSPSTEGQPLGWQSEENWTQTLNILEQYGGMESRKDLREYYTNDYLPE